MDSRQTRKEGLLIMNSMTFLHPEWFFFIPLLILIGWRFKFLRLHEPLRIIILTLFLLALTKPVINLGNGNMDVWLLVDHSESTEQKPLSASDEIRGILDYSKRSEDRVRIVDFAKEAVLRDKGDPVFGESLASTRIGRAIDYVLAQADSERTNRLLILTDGYPTDSLDESAAKLISSGIKADCRLFPHSFETDFSVSNIRYPSQVRPGESFLLEFTVQASEHINTTIPWEITKGDSPPLKGTATLEKGKARVRISDRLTTFGAIPYHIRILPPERDPIVQNNTATVWVEAKGGSGVLIVSPHANDPIAPFLTAQGIHTTVVNNPATLKPEHLSEFKLVIINNILASSFSPSFLDSLNFFVKEQGGGLLMCGGNNSFGAGGYFSSAIDPLLPVSMELRKEHRKQKAAMSFVLDRSGSMSVSAGRGMTKMDLANSGTVNAVELLSDDDFASVHAVDSSPHLIVPMTNVGKSRDKMLQAIPKIGSMGGGIFVEAGIRAGWKELKKVPVGTRHLILFSDARDSEEPGNYEQYISEMREDGITISVIALGEPSDVDAELLRRIAALGEGRIFFSTTGMDLPSIFSQETAAISRSAFIKEPTPLTPTPGWNQIASAPPAWPQHIEAYNLSYLKEGATAACLSADEYQAPLVAFWSRGAGRVGAISFPVSGKDAEQLLQWQGYGDFIQTYCRWLMGNSTPEGFSLKANLQGEQLKLDLLYSDEHAPLISRQSPESAIELATETGVKTINGIWEHIEPGRFQTTFLIDEGTYIRGAVKIGDYTIPFGPIAITSNAEWQLSPAQKEEFMKLISLSGGAERHDLPQIWNEPRDIRKQEITKQLSWAILSFILLDALLSRLGFSLLPKKKKASSDSLIDQSKM